MTNRQKALLQYHADLAAFSTTSATPVFVILDLEDKDGQEIAKNFQINILDHRDAIASSGNIPAYTLCLSLKSANKLIESGWPALRRLGEIPKGFVPVLLFSSGTCLSALVPAR